MQAFVAIHMKLNWFRGRFKVEGPIFRGKSMASGIGFPKKYKIPWFFHGLSQEKPCFFQEPLFGSEGWSMAGAVKLKKNTLRSAGDGGFQSEGVSQIIRIRPCEY